MKLTAKGVLNNLETMPYEANVRAIVLRHYADKGVPVEDLIQEGMLAWFQAKTTYKPDLGVKFTTYASRVVHNRLQDILRRQNTRDNQEADTPPVDVVGNSVEDDVAWQELLRWTRTVWQSCNALERRIIKMHYEGYKYQEIATQLSVTVKKIDNTIQKIRKMIKLNNEN